MTLNLHSANRLDSSYFKKREQRNKPPNNGQHWQFGPDDAYPLIIMISGKVRHRRHL